MAAYPLIDVAVIIGNEEFYGEALPDTGYDGTVIIPRRYGDEILLDAEQVILTMANGHEMEVNTWDGCLLLEDQSFTVLVQAFGDEFIIGREVLDRMEICFEFESEYASGFSDSDHDDSVNLALKSVRK